MSEKDKTQTQSGINSLQRETQSGEDWQRKKVKAVREGHATGGYIETEELKAEEKKLAEILSKKIADAEREKGHAATAEIRGIQREIAGFCWRPQLVVKAD